MRLEIKLLRYFAATALCLTACHSPVGPTASTQSVPTVMKLAFDDPEHYVLYQQIIDPDDITAVLTYACSTDKRLAFLSRTSFSIEPGQPIIKLSGPDIKINAISSGSPFHVQVWPQRPANWIDRSSEPPIEFDLKLDSQNHFRIAENSGLNAENIPYAIAAQAIAQTCDRAIIRAKGFILPTYNNPGLRVVARPLLGL